jgi:hypothetical protein
MRVVIRDSDLSHVGNQFTHDMDSKRFGINPIVKRWNQPDSLVPCYTFMMSKLVLEPE